MRVQTLRLFLALSQKTNICTTRENLYDYIINYEIVPVLLHSLRIFTLILKKKSIPVKPIYLSIVVTSSNKHAYSKRRKKEDPPIPLPRYVTIDMDRPLIHPVFEMNPNRLL